MDLKTIKPIVYVEDVEEDHSIDKIKSVELVDTLQPELEFV